MKTNKFIKAKYRELVSYENGGYARGLTGY